MLNDFKLFRLEFDWELKQNSLYNFYIWPPEVYDQPIFMLSNTDHVL